MTISDYTLDEALDAVGFGNYQLILMAYGGLGWIADAMEIMILSFIGSAVQSEWDLSPAEKSLISSVVFVGMLIGAYASGFVSDTYGRKKGILAVATVTAVSGLMSAFSPNYSSLLITRCVTGVGLGGMHIYGSWFIEFVPAPNRGAWMLALGSTWTIGVVLEVALAWIILPSYGWRWLIGLSAVPSFLILLLYGLVPESPRFLCMQGKTEEARIVMVKVASFNGKTLQDGNLVRDRFEESSDEENATPLLSSKDEKQSLFSSEFMRINLLLWFLHFGVAFSYYGVVLLTSELSSVQNANLYLDSFITSVAEVPGLVIAAFVVDRMGRKPTMGNMCVVSSILLLPLLIPQNEALTTILLSGARTFVSATSTVMAVFISEIYPTTIRSTGVGLASAIGRVGGMICPLVAVGLVNSYPQAYAVMLFVIITFSSGICVWLMPFDTKGRKLS